MPFTKAIIGLTVLLAMLMSACGLQAQQVLVLNEGETEPISIRPYAELLISPEEPIDETAILANASTFPFLPMIDFEENLGFTDAEVWIRFEIENATNETLDYYLETARPITDYVELFLKDESGAMVEQHSGDAIPFDQKSILHRKSVFKIRIPDGERLLAFIHLKSDGEVLMLPLDLISEKQFLYETYKEHIFYGFFYGVLLLACIIYLFFYSAMRSTAFVYYGAYVFFIALLQFSLDGFFHQYITPNGGWLSNRAVLASALVSLFFFGKYGQSFLSLEAHSPMLNRSISLMSIVIVTTLGLLFSFPAFLSYCYPIANVIGLLVLLQMIGAIIHLKIKGLYIDNYFTIGISFLIIGFIVFILNNLHIVPNSFYTENGAKFGIGLEIVFLSLSMGNRIRLLRERNEANQMLALQRAQDMNDIKSSFLSNISHELRTPLNLIMGVAASLDDKNANAELKEKCQLILSSSRNLMGHVEDILDFTVIEKGNQELKSAPFDLNCVLDKLVKENTIKATDKNLNFFHNTHKKVPEKVIGDKVKLYQILNNLLDNAVKFTATGNVTLFTHCEVKKDRTLKLNFVISDTGIGISKEKISTIFEALTKNSFLDKREFYGLGLGLYIVKSYVDLQKGSISVRENGSQGTVFEIELNLPYVEEVPEAQVKADAEKNRQDELRNTSILLVEDNKMNQKVIALYARKWKNVRLDIAENGLEALKLIKENDYDIVLMDLQMPVMDGFETTATIRSGKAGKRVSQIPIIVVTADSTDETKKEIFRLGANGYVTKPVNGNLLLEKIKENLITVY